MFKRNRFAKVEAVKSSLSINRLSKFKGSIDIHCQKGRMYESVIDS